MKSLRRFFLPVLIALSATGFQKAPPKKAPASPVLQGMVRDSEGKAVENALVLAVPVDRSYFYAEAPLSTRTDASGRFSLTLKSHAPHKIRVEAQGLAPETLKRVEPGPPLSITLTKGRSIEGTVRDGKTLEPVAGARVEARDAGGLSLPSEPDTGRVEALTDEKGFFRLDGLGAGLHHVTASARGYASASKESARAGARADLLLFPGSSIVGIVRGAGGRPAEGALVRAEAKGMPFGPPWIATTPRRTDAQGRFELNGLKEGDYNVIVRHPEWAPAIVSSVAVGAERETEVEAVLSRGASLVGRLVNPDDQPAAGRVTVQELNGEPTSRSVEDLLGGETDEQGQFRIERVPSGTHALAIIAPGYAAERVEVSVGDRASAVDVGDIKLATGLSIRGHVTSQAGLPVVGATVRAFGMRPSMTLGLTGGQRWVESSSESDGSFVLAGLSPGMHRLDVSAPGYGRTGLERVEAGTEKLAIVLKPAGTIRGVVVDQDGRPVDGYQVMAQPAQQRSVSYGFDSASSPDGSFSLEDLAEGVYVVQVHAPGRVTGVVSDVKVAPGAVTDVGRITLRKGGSVRGFVIDSSGQPIAGAKVTVFPPGRNYVSWGMEPNAISNGEGFFEVTGVPEGTVEALAQHPSYAEGRVSGLEVSSRLGATETRIVLSLGGRLEGWIRSRDGSGLSAMTVTADPVGTRSNPFGSNRVKSSNEGYFVFESLPAGRTQVFLMRETGAAFTSTQRREVEVREGETAQIEFNLREILVSGRVTRGAAPAGGLFVRLLGFPGSGSGYMMVSGPGRVSVAAPAAGPQPLNAITREDGGYELLAENPGKYSVMVSTPDYGMRLPTREVEIPDQDAFTLDITFSGATVSGVVLDKETEEVISGAYVGASVHPPAKEYPPRSSPGSTMAGPGGRFELELEPGDYKITAMHEGYLGEPAYLKVDAAGATDLRLLLARGYSIRGRVVNRYGQPVGGTGVMATTGEPPETASPGARGWAQTLADGSFVMEGLGPRRYTLFVDSGRSGFALQPGVKPGSQEVELVLAPGGRARFQVRGADELPIEGASLQLVSVGGASVRGGGSSSTTASDGVAEMDLPSGQVELEVKKELLKTTLSLRIAPGASVPAKVVLR